MQELIVKRLSESRDAIQKLASDQKIQQNIALLASKSIASLGNGGRILLCGNGGSASDAQHIAAELSGKYLKDRDPLDAEALHTNTSYLTAVANDYDYSHVYKRAVQAKGRKGDVLIALSTSGNSPNILAAIEQAKKMGLFTTGMTGLSGGKLKEISDLCLCIPSNDTPRIQEGHIIIGHILCELIESTLFP